MTTHMTNSNPILRHTLTACIAAAALLITCQATRAQQPELSSLPPTPQQIALGRWYVANQAGAVHSVGLSPHWATFDGAHLWISNSDSNTVTKLRAADGQLLGEYPAGQIPLVSAFDGKHLWVVNAGVVHRIVRIRASDGKLRGSFPLEASARAVLFDGKSIWVALPTANKVLRMDPRNGEIEHTIAIEDSPGMMTFDGSRVWVASSSGEGRVTAIDAGNGVTVANLVGVPDAAGITYDGKHLWVANHGQATVTRIVADDPDAETTPLTFEVPDKPQGMLFDGRYVWVACVKDSVLVALDPISGKIVSSTLTGAGPTGLAFDGANIWVVNRDQGIVTKH